MLAVTQTVGYGVLFYAFAVMLVPMAAELQTNTATITGAFTVSILTSAAAAIPIGRWLDRHGGRLLMTCGSIAATGAVIAWSRVTSVAQIYAVFVLIGLASAMVLYEAAFPVIVAATDNGFAPRPANAGERPKSADKGFAPRPAHTGERPKPADKGLTQRPTHIAERPKPTDKRFTRRRPANTAASPKSAGGTKRDSAILAVTMVAGLAGTAFLPLIGVLLERYGWRTTLLILAALLAIITIPAHFFAVPGNRQHAARKTAHHGAGVGQALRDKGFWLLTSAFVLHGAAVWSVGIHLVGYLRHAGHPTTVAATLAGLLGLLSVTGRLATTGFARRHSMGTVTAIVLLVQAAGAAALTQLSHTIAGAAACIVAFGLGFGVSTIARPGDRGRPLRHRHATRPSPPR